MKTSTGVIFTLCFFGVLNTSSGQSRERTLKQNQDPHNDNLWEEVSNFSSSDEAFAKYFEKVDTLYFNHSDLVLGDISKLLVLNDIDKLVLYDGIAHEIHWVNQGRRSKKNAFS